MHNLQSILKRIFFKNLPYKEALKYIKEKRFIQADLDGSCDYGLPFSVEQKYVEADKIVNEHRIQEFLNYKFIKPSRYIKLSKTA